MHYRTRVTLAFGRLQRKYRVGAGHGLYRVSALIRSEARQSMRVRRKSSSPGTPPSVHNRPGLKEINFDVAATKTSSIIGPRKFPRSNFFNRTIPNIHEKGGTTVYASFRRRFVARYPERSFMWNAVKSLSRKGKIQREFNITLQRSW